MELLGDFTLFKQGAEAKLYKGNYLGRPAVIKERFVKEYRHPELDKILTRERIKAECRAIVKCKSAGVLTPTIYLVDMPKHLIIMEYFENCFMAKDFISKADETSIQKLSRCIGSQLAKMHSSGIVHGDLTTSNILLTNAHCSDPYSFTDETKIAFIDFGLAQLEATAEDKGVDLYVLERALISTHAVAERIFLDILREYKKQYGNCKEVIQKYEEIRARGRKRTMVG